MVAARGGHLALGHLTVGPWPGADSELDAGSTPFHGITSEVLRAIRPQQLIRQITDRLNTLEEWHIYLSQKHGLQAPAQQRQQLKQTIERVRAAGLHGRKYPDDHYRDIALLFQRVIGIDRKNGVVTVQT